MLLFKLTMPNVGSWNGIWTAASNFYGKTKKLSPKLENEMDGKSWFYRWDDGWTACVSCEKMPAREANKAMKKSKGFCGYEWMIASILKHNEILIERKEV